MTTPFGRRSPSGGPLVSPLELGQCFMWMNADLALANAAGDVLSWQNAAGRRAVFNSAGTVAPELGTINGARAVEFFGDSITSGVGSWMTTQDESILNPFRFLGSRANVYLLCTVQPTIIGDAGGACTIFCASQAAASSNFTSLEVNSLNRPVRWLVATTGINGLMHPAGTKALDPMLIEIRIQSEPFVPLVTDEMRLNGAIINQQNAQTIGDQTPALDLATIGATGRNSTFTLPAGVLIRDIVGCYGELEDTERWRLRAWAAARAGITVQAAP